MFLEKDERLLIMDIFHCPPHQRLPLSDLVKLESVGVKTLYVDNFDFNLPDWHSIINDILENTDLKLLLSFWNTPPPGRNWFIGKEINYRDSMVGESIDEFTLELLDHLSSVKDRVQLTYAYSLGGEFLWAESGNWGKHEHENEMVAEWIVERQKILSSQHNEVWMVAHDAMGGTLHTMLVVNNALYAAFPDCTHYRIQHLYMPWFPWTYKNEPKLIPLRRVPWAKYFVGSEYVPGLSTNFDKGMEHGVWGFLTSPIHADTNKTQIDDQMLEDIKVAIERLSLEPDYSGAWEERPLIVREGYAN